MLDGIDKLIGCGIRPAEGRKLHELGRLATAPIVEIGCHQGRSACYLAADAKVLLYAIDLWDIPVVPARAKIWAARDVWVSFLRQVESVGLSERIVPVRADSRVVGPTWSEPIGVLHIDGDHSFEGCSADYRNFAHHVVPGGYIALHDRTHQGVARVIAETIEPSGEWRNVELVGSLYVARRMEEVA